MPGSLPRLLGDPAAQGGGLQEPTGTLAVTVRWPSGPGPDNRGYRAQLLPDSSARVDIAVRAGSTIAGFATVARSPGAGSVTKEIKVKAGTGYTVEVKAFPPAPYGGAAIAQGSISDVAITAGGSTAAAVSLASLFAPTITALGSVVAGSTATITGTNFLPAHLAGAKPTVAFAQSGGGITLVPAADVTVDSDTQLTVKVPADVASGDLVVTHDGVPSARFAYSVMTGLAYVATYAGGAWGSLDFVPRWDARFYNVRDVAVDGGGNAYVTEQYRVRKIAADGTVTTLAGSRAGERGYLDGTGTDARFTDPAGVAVDSAGNVYVSEGDVMYAQQSGGRIRKITPAGVVSTLAASLGSETGLMALDGAGNLVFGAGTAVRKISTAGGSAATLADGFRRVGGLAVDQAGNVFVTDIYKQTVHKVSPGGTVTTIAGTSGSYGSADGTGAAARFYSPIDVELDAAGNLYVAEHGNLTIRKIAPGGVVTTLAGSAGVYGAVDGVLAEARFRSPFGLGKDASGQILVADEIGIRRVQFAAPEPAPTATPVPLYSTTKVAGVPLSPGSADGPAAIAQFKSPMDVAVDSAGNLYVADASNHTIRKVTASGVVSTLAGSPGATGHVNATGAAARFNRPNGVAVDAAGNVYVADVDNSAIRKITPAGLVSDLVADFGSQKPRRVALDRAGFLYASVGWSIRKINLADGSISLLAGSLGWPGSDDGTGESARFGSPEGIAVDGAGNLYVAEPGQCRIRKVTPAGEVTTIAGLAGLLPICGSADGLGMGFDFELATFNNPTDVAVDGQGHLFVTDAAGSTIRMIDVNTTVVTTIAGRAETRGYQEGTGSDALFVQPAGLDIDGSGALYVVDAYHSVIRKVSR